MFFQKTLHRMTAVISAVFLLLSLFPVLNNSFNNGSVIAEAASEPYCAQTNTDPVYNPYPINFNSPNPVDAEENCQDIPLLSFFPIDTGAGNPREINIVDTQNISFSAYYNNGASANDGLDNITGESIMNPNLKIDVNQVSDTRFCISGTLSGSNVTSVTSSQKGGDICINAPTGTNLEIVANTVTHFPDAIERLEETNSTGRTPNDDVPDNTVGTTISNPIYSSFPGTNLPSTSGFTFKDKLEPGFLGYGYVLGQILAVVPEVQDNQPPSLPGQEITIVRGDSGSFDTYAGTDPDGDLPLTYVTLDLPAFCNEENFVVTCQSDEQTPVRSTFNVVPYDSKGLAGQPAEFIVNIIEADKAVLATSEKVCVKSGTQDNCETAKIQPTEEVTYTISVTNTGKETATNVVVVDDYDESFLENIVPAENNNIDTTDQEGFLTFNVGSIEPDVTVNLSYNATVKEDVANGTTVVNTATISADDLPDHTVSTQFPVVLPNNPILSTSEKVCVRKNTSTSCDQANMKPGEVVTYRIDIKNTGDTTAFNVQVEDNVDEDKLENFTNISPDPEVLDDPITIITWNLGNIEAGEGKTIEYDATIQGSVTNGTKIENQAIVSADNLPDIELETDFTVNVVTTTTSRSGGSAIAIILIVAAIAGGGYYYYKKNGKLGKKFIPERNSKK